MSNGLRITYVPLADATPEKELDALAGVYKFILDRHAKNATGISGGKDDAKPAKNERRST
jgi:hypothetical protein